MSAVWIETSTTHLYQLLSPKHENKLYLVKDKNTRENYSRVTNILYPFSGLDKINPEIVANAAERGTKVHKICEGIVLGLGEIGVEEEIRGYVDSFNKWWSRGHEVVSVEQRFWDDDLKITGQVDLILKTPEGLIIVDIKTSSRPSKTWQAQGCGYAYLAKKSGLDICKIHFLHLNRYGNEAQVHEYQIDDGFFLAIYRVWAHFFQKD